MKRSLAFLLALILSLSLASCSSLEGAEIGTREEPHTGIQTQENTEEGPTKPEKIPHIADKLSWEKINAFPVVGENMTPDEARELCVDFFRFCQTFAWTPSESLTFKRNSSGALTTLKAGTVYGGLPYGNVSSGSVYRLMEFYDEETGVVDMKRATPDGETQYFANQCSIGAYWGWGRAINSANYNWTEEMTLKNGFLPVGSYTYDKTLSSFSKYSTNQICKDNGEAVMYEAYAQMKPADGLVYYKSSGHVIMCSSVPNVVRVNGVIDPEKSTFTYIDQGQNYREMQQSDGSKFMVQGGVDRVRTFKKAFESGYLPFTFAEFLGENSFESPSATLGLGESATVEEVRTAAVKSNYGISDIYISFINADGSVAETKIIRAKKAGSTEIKMESKLMAGNLLPHVGKTVRFEVQQSSGVKLVAWEGTLKE